MTEYNIKNDVPGFYLEEEDAKNFVELIQECFFLIYNITGNDNLKQEQNISVGGQAVIEGVMMRGPKTIAVAVRKPNGDIVVKSKPFKSITQKIKFLGLPILRGGVVLIETLVLGIKALTFSGDVAMESEEEKKKEEKSQNKFLNSLWMGVTVVISFGLGLLLFFYVPLLHL